MTFAHWMASGSLLVIAGIVAFVWAFRAPRSTFDEHAKAACAIAAPRRRRPLRVDTTTGSHDHIPMRDDVRQMLADYCEGMWHHTQETP